jgi:ABC-type Fe3+-hydroxamate transport system substrate-binding protein
MKNTKIFACILASMMACAAFTACGSESSSSTSDSSSEASESSAADVDAEEEVTDAPLEEVEVPEFEDAIAAESGDAYLAIVDGQWWVQYWGSIDDDGSMLAYDAGVVPITGDGDYTVSVTADTSGFRYDTTGDANGDYTPSGCSFAAVMVKDGTTLYPDMAIEITSIKIDGNDVDLTSKNFTSSDDGVEMRANIYNEWVTDLPEDAHDANGAVTDASAYSAQIVDPAAFADGWTTVEVNFTVTGTGA